MSRALELAEQRLLEAAGELERRETMLQRLEAERNSGAVEVS